jgi:hypothetical protein
MTYTYGVQFVDSKPEEVEDRGVITVEGAVAAFREFPFLEQLDDAQGLAAPTFPTVSFKCSEDGSALAIWSTEADEYEVYLEMLGRRVTIREGDFERIENTIRQFFGADRLRLFRELAQQPGAVVLRTLGARLRDLFA